MALSLLVPEDGFIKAFGRALAMNPAFAARRKAVRHHRPLPLFGLRSPADTDENALVAGDFMLLGWRVLLRIGKGAHAVDTGILTPERRVDLLALHGRAATRRWIAELRHIEAAALARNLPDASLGMLLPPLESTNVYIFIVADQAPLVATVDNQHGLAVTVEQWFAELRQASSRFALDGEFGG